MAEILRYLIILLGGCRGNSTPFQRSAARVYSRSNLGRVHGGGETQKKPSVNSHVWERLPKNWTTPQTVFLFYWADCENSSMVWPRICNIEIFYNFLPTFNIDLFIPKLPRLVSYLKYYVLAWIFFHGYLTWSWWGPYYEACTNPCQKKIGLWSFKFNLWQH